MELLLVINRFHFQESSIKVYSSVHVYQLEWYHSWFAELEWLFPQPSIKKVAFSFKKKNHSISLKCTIISFELSSTGMFHEKSFDKFMVPTVIWNRFEVVWLQTCSRRFHKISKFRMMSFSTKLHKSKTQWKSKLWIQKDHSHSHNITPWEINCLEHQIQNNLSIIKLNWIDNILRSILLNNWKKH